MSKTRFVGDSQGTTTPGQFRARCAQGAWLPVDEITEEERMAAEAEDAQRRAEGKHSDVFKWDREKNVETAHVHCDLDTTDRDEYVAHMERVHGRTTRNWAPSKVTGNGRLAASVLTPWEAPRLYENGAPLKVRTKQDAARVRTCEHCGLVAEVGDRHAGHQWWNEHTSFCTERN